MNLSELISLCEDEVRQQWLDQNLDRADMGKKGGKITFHCPNEYVKDLALNSPPEHIGLILWLPREKVVEALSKEGA